MVELGNLAVEPCSFDGGIFAQRCRLLAPRHCRV
uniref:Uncharacterized protein n=1 Tax=Arundo donax TaxID=35708 RepID=A0A0A9U710_ARUDO